MALINAARPRARLGVSRLEKALWATLVVWVLGFAALETAAALFGFRPAHVEYLGLAAVLALAAVTLLSLLGPPPLAGELRRLRTLAVVLPVAFIAAVEVGLYLLTADQIIAEPAQHVLAMAVLSAGVIPLSLYVFSVFARLRDELAAHAARLEALHGTSLAITKETHAARLTELIAGGALSVVAADRAILQLAPPRRSEAAAPRGVAVSEWERELADSVREGGVKMRAPGDGRSAIAVPIGGGRVVGALVAVWNAPRAISSEDEMILDMFAVAASSGLENARRLEEAQLLATVEERERIARDLHDDLGQLLGFLSTKVQAVRELVARGRAEEAAQELAGLEGSIRSLGTEVREAILGLRAQAGPARPLGTLLQDYATDFGALTGLDLAFEGPAEAGADLSPHQQSQLFRIAQEAMSNARRHAGATRISVRVTEDGEDLELSVTDDGRGFDPSRGTSGFGLQTMQERAGSADGTLMVESAPGAGTTVRARVPLPEYH